VPELNEQIKANARRERELTLRFDESHRRHLLKSEVINAMLDGEISLQEATARFLALLQSEQPSMISIRSSYKGNTDLEKAARNVLTHAMRQMTGTRVEKAEIFARLTREFQLLTGAAFHEPFYSGERDDPEEAGQ
jgi:hypothetical protein